MKYFKDFDSWNIKKQKIDNDKPKLPYFKEREIWWLSIGVNVGYEEDGKHEDFLRPVLVITKFNQELFLGVPLSTKVKDNRYYIKIKLKGRTISAMISQIRTFSSKRILYKLGELDSQDFMEVVNNVRILLPLSQEGESRG